MGMACENCGVAVRQGTRCTDCGGSLLEVWTIYQRPADYPGGFVARMHVVGATAALCGPTDRAYFGPTLDSVRGQLPSGLVCLGREAGDEPQIVESWI